MWVAESQYDVLGTRFGVRSDDAQVGEWVQSLLGPFRSSVKLPVRQGNMFALASRRPGDDRHHSYRDCKRLGRSVSWTTVVDLFLGELNRRTIDAMTFFGAHAGVISYGERTIALPGGSGVGKTTLVGACLQAGFHYVSDEALCVDYSTGSVVPYPKPLSLSEWSLEALKVNASELKASKDGSKAPIRAETIGGVIATAPAHLTDLVLFERQSGAATLRELPRSRVVAGLIGYSFNHYKRPAETFSLATELARHCQGWALTYEHPQDAADLLRSELT